MASPLPHQLPALARHVEVLSRYNATLEASIPGFGKTYVAGFLAQYLKLRPGVVCPKSVVPHWQRAMRDVGVEPLFVTNYEQAKLAKFAHGGWRVKNRIYEWAVPQDTLLVLDECHRFKTRTSQTAKLMLAARHQAIKTIAMSATAAKDPLDLYALGFLLNLHDGADYLSFAFRHGVFKGTFSFEFNPRSPAGQDALLRLNQLIFPAHGYRATYSDIPGFPANTIETVPVEIENPKSVDDLFEEAERLEQLHAEATEPIVIRLRARQKAELLKVPIFSELIRDHLAEGQSVAVFVNFLETLEQLAEKFPGAAIVRGGQSQRDRQDAIDGFQCDARPIILCQAQAGGVGISLHDLKGEHPRVSLISPPESAITLVQILGRIHRAGAKSPALQKIIFASNTIEERVRRAVDQKVNNIALLNDGDLDPTES